MTKGNPTNVAASVRARLTEFARTHQEEFQNVLTRYAIERFLYRLSISPFADAFVLKGAMLFRLWTSEPHRMTKDVDLHGTGVPSLDRLIEVVRLIGAVVGPDDGLTFETTTVSATRIKEGQDYEGVRVTCPVRLGNARLQLQIDVGFGDAITPPPVRVDFPTILDFPAPALQAYPKETVVAEKFQAMAALGMLNSRMKDYFDLWILARDFEFDGGTLARAVTATFDRRGSVPPTETPVALSAEFAGATTKVAQWEAFVRKGKLAVGPDGLQAVIAMLHGFLMPLSRAAATGNGFAARWLPGGPWVMSDK